MTTVLDRLRNILTTKFSVPAYEIASDVLIYAFTH